MEIIESRFIYGLNARANTTQTNVFGSLQIGKDVESVDLNANKAASLKANLPANGSFTFTPATGVALPVGNWADDVEYQSLQLVGGGWGDAIITNVAEVSFTGYTPETGALDAIIVAVTTGQTPEVWGQAVCDVINIVLANSGYRLRMNGTEMILEPDPNAETPGVVDSNCTFYLGGPTSGFSTKISTLATRPSQFSIFDGEGNDFDGNPLAPIVPAAMLIKTTPSCTITIDPDGVLVVPANGIILFKGVPEGTQWIFTAAAAGGVEITLVG
jgi:hypothetical protein